MSGMKIVIYKDNLSTGRGADHLVCAQAEGLSSLGHDVTLATCPTDKPFTFPVADTVKVDYVPRETIREFSAQFDVCIAAGSNEICDLTDNGRLSPVVPTITELMVVPRGFFKWKRFIRNRRIKRAFNRSHMLQILCASYEKELRVFAPDPDVVTIGDWPDVREPTAAELSGAKRRKVIVYPAAVNKLKNQLLLIRAFGAIASDFPDWELHIYGRMHPKYGAKCRKAAADAGLFERIKFFPFTDDLPSVYASSEIMAFPSLLEGFPLTILEGACFALPSVVVKELPGAEEMIEDGVTGIVSRNDVASYAESLRVLMSDESLRRKLGNGAHTSVSERFTKEMILRQWDEAVRRVAEGK